MQKSGLIVRACAACALLGLGTGRAHADREVQALVLAAGAVIVAAVMQPDHIEGEGPDHVSLEAGQLDRVKRAQRADAYGGEYRGGRFVWWKLRPFAGAGFTSRDSLYAYAGIRFSTSWAQRIVITPSFAVGGYRRGRGKDLGHPPLVGRSGLDFEYGFEGGVRIGLAYHHMSNGKLLGQTDNPGTEIVGLTLAVPLR